MKNVEVSRAHLFKGHLTASGLSLATLLLAGSLALTGCGGGGGSGGSDSASGSAQSSESVSMGMAQAEAVTATTSSALPSRAEAFRFLVQTTFGPTEADIQRVMSIGYSAWLDEQLADTMQPAMTYRAFWAKRVADQSIEDPLPTGGTYTRDMVNGFYTFALTDRAQLKHRVALAWSEIMVASLADGFLAFDKDKFANYMDLLAKYGTSDYRTLLEKVSRSPAMANYLSYVRNQKEDTVTGRVPDQNFAREIMQLFSIGLYKLNQDGTLMLGSNGEPLETYTQDDIVGLSKVFTGWGYYKGAAYAGVSESDCFWGTSKCLDPEGSYQPMQGYASYHSTSAKSFLGVTIGVQQTANPEASIKTALDTVAAHSNVAPFISKLLIQRLVTSNPSKYYVSRIAWVFKSTNGDLKSVIKAIYLDSEARSATSLVNANTGKVKEPVLRLTQLLRAFKHRSDSMSVSASPLFASSPRMPFYAIGTTSDAATSLGQTPYYSPSVFNFFRPGYVPPQSQTAANGMVAPELQIASETAVAGYVNSIKSYLDVGLGEWRVYDADGKCGIMKKANASYPSCAVDTASRYDVRFDYTNEKAVAGNATNLVTLIADRLLGGQISSGLRSVIETAVNSIAVPALRADKSNQSTIDTMLERRVKSAIFLVMISPEFLVQK